MVFSQNVNWFILYQLADKMAIVFLGLAHAPIFLEVWLGDDRSIKGEYTVIHRRLGNEGRLVRGYFRISGAKYRILRAGFLFSQE